MGINFIKAKPKVSKSFKKFLQGLRRALASFGGPLTMDRRPAILVDSNVRICSHMSLRVLENLKVVFAQAETAFLFGLAFFGLLIFF